MLEHMLQGVGDRHQCAWAHCEEWHGMKLHNVSMQPIFLSQRDRVAARLASV